MIDNYFWLRLMFHSAFITAFMFLVNISGWVFNFRMFLAVFTIWTIVYRCVFKIEEEEDNEQTKQK